MAVQLAVQIRQNTYTAFMPPNVNYIEMFMALIGDFQGLTINQSN